MQQPVTHHSSPGVPPRATLRACGAATEQPGDAQTTASLERACSHVTADDDASAASREVVSEAVAGALAIDGEPCAASDEAAADDASPPAQAEAGEACAASQGEQGADALVASRGVRVDRDAPWAAGRMRAVRLDGPGLAPRLDRVPVPRLADGEALLRVLAAGVCHTELQLLDGTLNPGVWPLTPGHEIVGEVLDGPSSLLGARALVYYGHPCGECSFCLAGQEQVCPNAGPQPGLSTDGGFADLVRVQSDCLIRLPPGLGAVDAAPLGCAAATALHALDGVAGVAAGETMVVYGVGGVGLALIQLGALRGARVVAIGRTPAKLQLARELGASVVVDATAADPVLAVARATAGEGAHVVFELVGASSTLEAGVDMLRRQGRLILVGYGSAQLRINPLKLVLRETRLLGALGSTRAELEEVVRLAASGALRMPIAGEYALESAAAALEELRAGSVVGRAVVVPGRGVEPSGRGAELSGHVAELSGHGAAVSGRALSAAEREAYELDRGAASVSGREHVAPERAPSVSERGAATVSEREAATEREREAATVPARAALVPGARSSAAAPGPGAGSPASSGVLAADLPHLASHEASRGRATVGGPPLEAELLAFVGQGVDAPRDDAAFSQLAVRLFAYQFATNRAYRLLCERRGQTPHTVGHWRDIPPVPIAAFKEAVLATEPVECAAEFNSSGTTRPEHKSRHFHPSLALYDANARLNFKAHVLPDAERMRCVVLFPHRSEMPNSSLAHWLTLMVEAFGAGVGADARGSSRDADAGTGDGLTAEPHAVGNSGHAGTEGRNGVAGAGHVGETSGGHVRPEGGAGRTAERDAGETNDGHVENVGAEGGNGGVGQREAGPRAGADAAAHDAWFVTSAGGLDAARLALTLDSASRATEPVLVLAASFGLVHFLEYCLSNELRFQLPRGSRVMDTGGYKGRSREYARDELYALITDRLGVPDSHIVNMYGMTEHGTQFLDNTLRIGDRQRFGGQRFKVVPPWARTLVVDPETLREVPRGERGLLLHFDLINRASVLAVLSEDVGRAVGDGFELFGRASASEARGCSIALDELIEAVARAGVRP